MSERHDAERGCGLMIVAGSIVASLTILYVLAELFLW